MVAMEGRRERREEDCVMSNELTLALLNHRHDDDEGGQDENLQRILAMGIRNVEVRGRADNVLGGPSSLGLPITVP